MSKKEIKVPVKKAKSKKGLMVLYTAFLFLLSFGVGMMPFGSSNRDESMVYIYISGASFWLGIIGVAVMAIIITVKRRSSVLFKEQNKEKNLPGLISFFKNKVSTVFDIIMLTSAVGFAVAIIWINDIWISTVLLAVLIFSFGMHCMLNGINYKYIKFK